MTALPDYLRAALDDAEQTIAAFGGAGYSHRDALAKLVLAVRRLEASDDTEAERWLARGDAAVADAARRAAARPAPAPEVRGVRVTPPGMTRRRKRGTR